MALIVPKLQRHQHCAGMSKGVLSSTLKCNACRHIQRIYLRKHELQGTSIQGQMVRLSIFILPRSIAAL